MEVIEGRDIFADDFIRQDQENQEEGTPSEIQKFFEGTNIFITGGTGFFGRILTEKLLRACWKLNKIYLLARPKKGKSVQTRFNELFDEPLFEPLRKCHPDFQNKIVLLEGDLSKDKDIITAADRQMLVDDVSIIFHCAATVRFDEKIRTAININVKSTKFIVDMAHEMKNLKAFVHVSTAYSNCIIKEIKEQFYPPPFNYQKITRLLEALDDAILDKITPELLQSYPNTYAFSKVIAEDVIRQYGKGLPIGMLRPSIVISTYKEPIAGWINNYYGPQGVVYGAGLGLLRTLHCDPDVYADMVPVDLTINALLALAWDLGQTKGDNPNFEKLSWKETVDSNSNVEQMEMDDDIPILNYVSCERNPITWAKFLDGNYKTADKNRSPLQLWYSSLTLNRNYYKDRVTRVLCHLLPALVVDLTLIAMQKEPMMWKAFKKIHKFSNVLSYFCTAQWKFGEENVIKLWNKLPRKDKNLFNFDIASFEWDEYFQWYVTGIRAYLIKDNLAVDPKEHRRAFRLKIYHYTIVALFNSLVLYMLYKIFCYLFL